MTREVFWIVFPLWFKAFMLTLMFEVPVFWAIARQDKKLIGSCPTWRVLVAAATGTCLTHPLFWFVWPLVVNEYNAYIISGELLIAFVETFIFMLVARPIRFRFALMASFVANAVSFGAGIVVRLLQ